MQVITVCGNYKLKQSQANFEEEKNYGRCEVKYTLVLCVRI